MRPGDEPLEQMGFYTLTDSRCRDTTGTSPLGRCVLVVTERCNFACPYCRTHDGRHMRTEHARQVIRLWAENGLFALMLTGGEPTVHPGLLEMVKFAKGMGIPRVGLGTNGAADPELYGALVDSGVDDFSISLDADNAEDGALLSGRSRETWHRVVENTRALAARTRVTVGVVVTEANVGRAAQVVRFALDLGVADVRVNPAAQYAERLPAMDLDPELTRGHPVLAWRLRNQALGVGVRGLRDDDPDRCWLALDEMTVNQRDHYPCFIYMREGGKPIGPVGADVRAQRARWVQHHNPKDDPICRRNCPDCLVAFNRRFELLHPGSGGARAAGSRAAGPEEEARP
jgi:molybdenum cofactor biosynthesis enzyme MoaA